MKALKGGHLKQFISVLGFSSLFVCTGFCETGGYRSVQRAEQPHPVPSGPFLRATAPVSSKPSETWGSPASTTQPRYAKVNDQSAPPSSQSIRSSVYIPVDSWIYPAVMRLYSLGFADSLFIGVRPWTRLSLLHVLQASVPEIQASSSEEAKTILLALQHYLSGETTVGAASHSTLYGIDTIYTRTMGIGGTPLRDSFHLGQTFVNDFGRPYQQGFNLVSGASATIEQGRFSFYARGEYQHAPTAMGYSAPLADQLSALDLVGPYAPPNAPQTTIPSGPIASQNRFQLLEATLSAHVLGHEISGGKSDMWLGPARGGAMAWSNNAENLYSVRIDRIEPLRLPLLSRVLGPVRYEFMYGSLKGHTAPNNPYMHMELIAFRPSSNFEFAFIRTVIFGGKGHEPVTLKTFLRSFLSVSDVSVAQKNSASDPGARFSDFNFSYRLPLMRNFATVYVDSIAHDDVSPISAPRRAAFRTGLELSHLPKCDPLELRLEAVTTDPPVSVSQRGTFQYWENVQRQGYTNNGFIIGDWIGREAKGGQAWLTYHTTALNSVELQYLHKKTAKDFIAGGTTQNQISLGLSRHLTTDLLFNASVQYEHWKAPIYQAAPRSNTSTMFQLTYWPRLRGASPQP